MPEPTTPLAFSRVALVGAGAIGGWIGAGLARAGCRLQVLARGATLQALSTHGLRLQTQAVGGALSTESHAVDASDDARALGVQDLVVVAVKAPALVQMSQQIGPLIGPHTVVLTAMNGVPWWFLQGLGAAWADRRLTSVDAGGELARAIPLERVMGCVVHASCSAPEPGVSRHHFGRRLIIGEPVGGATPRARLLGELLARAGFDAEVSPRIQKDIWFKLWGNMTINPVSALTGATTDLILADDLVRDFTSRVMTEAKAIGKRLGLPIDQQPQDRHAVTLKLGAFKTSMLQDLEAGRPLELDALVSAVRELGQLTGVPTPDTDTLLGLSRLQARVRGLY